MNISDDDTTLVRLLNRQITELSLNSYDNGVKSTDRQQLKVFAMILFVGKHLCDLNFNQYILKNPSSLNLGRSLSSSTITKLTVSVDFFDECLYLLDGRFESLSTLVIKITAVLDSLSTRENQVKVNIS